MPPYRRRVSAKDSSVPAPVNRVAFIPGAPKPDATGIQRDFNLMLNIAFFKLRARDGYSPGEII